MPTYVQRARRRTFAVGGALLVAVPAGTLATGVDAGGLMFAGWGLAVGGTLLLVSRSQVVTSDDEVVVRNPFRRYVARWSVVEAAERGARLPLLRLRDGRTIKVEGVEPFPQAFSSRRSLDVLEAFEAEVQQRTTG